MDKTIIEGFIFIVTNPGALLPTDGKYHLLGRCLFSTRGGPSGASSGIVYSTAEGFGLVPISGMSSEKVQDLVQSFPKDDNLGLEGTIDVTYLVHKALGKELLGGCRINY